MSYKISYGNEPDKTAQKGGLWRPIAAMLAIVFAVMARFCYPDETKKLTDALFPLTSASAQEALEVFAQNIKAGESFNDAVTAFCSEIINEAGIS